MALVEGGALLGSRQLDMGNSGLLGFGVISAADPPLIFVEVQKDGVGGVDGLDDTRSVTLSPDGKHIYAAGGADDAVALFSRDSTTGALTFVTTTKDGVGGVDGLDGAVSVTLSPDGKHVYAAGGSDNALATFSRTSTTGVLTFVTTTKDGVNGVDGLSGVRWVTVSPDGKHVYTAAGVENAVAVFSRNSTTGALTFVTSTKHGVGTLSPIMATVSPDGKHVYVSNHFDDAVAVFSRNSTTGLLTFVEVQQDGVGVVDGLDGAFAVTLSPSGLRLYVSGNFDDAVAVFIRNPTTGALTFDQVVKDGVSGVDGLDAADALAISPDGKHLYAGGGVDDAVAVFRSQAPPHAVPSFSQWGLIGLAVLMAVAITWRFRRRAVPIRQRGFD